MTEEFNNPSVVQNDIKMSPIYLVIDRSGSMTEVVRDGKSKLDIINEFLPKLQDSILSSAVGDFVRVSVVAFDTSASVELPLSALDPSVQMPVLSSGGGTSYGSGLGALPAMIHQDRKQAGLRVTRPLIFFLTDGEPTDGDGWRAPFEQLTTSAPADSSGNPVWANIIPVGIGVDEAGPAFRVLQQMVFPTQGKLPAEYANRANFVVLLSDPSVLTGLIEALTKSIVSVGKSNQVDGGGAPAPAPGELLVGEINKQQDLAGQIKIVPGLD